jgi:electron transfer flavoprotein beta subunit
MRILVCLKQAMDVTQIKVDKTSNRLVIQNVPKKISDFDKNGLEEAIQLKEKFGGEVVCVTVGPEEARITIREALAMGADKAYLITDESFRESDTLATSYILAEAIKKIGDFDLILCGEASIDSYSALVGPRLAEQLNLPLIAYCRRTNIEDDVIVAERTLEESYQTVKVKIPALVTVTREINEPRIPTLMAVMKASKKEIIVWKREDLNMPEERVGKKGSGVVLKSVFPPKMERKRIVFKEESVKDAAEKLARALFQEGIIKR